MTLIKTMKNVTAHFYSHCSSGHECQPGKVPGARFT